MKRISKKISEVCSVKGGGTPSTKKEEYWNGNIPWLAPKELTNYSSRFISTTEKSISSLGLAKSSAQLMPAGSILLTSRATIGNVAINLVPMATNQGFINIICNENLYRDYFYYWLKQNKETLISNAHGTTFLELIKSVFKNLEIDIPENVSDQQKIASILSAYDDLIENNTRRIKILEEMAQTIYKEWFVNFRFPGHEKVKFVESPLGKIPAGWEVKTLYECIEYYIGGGWGNEDMSDTFSDGAFVIRGTDIPSLKVGDISNTVCRFHKRSNLNSRKLQIDDIVFEVSGGSKGQPVGRSILIGKNLLNQWENDIMCASFCKLIRVKKDEISPYQIYLYLIENYQNGVIEQYQVQSTGISNFKFESFINEEQITVPPKVIREAFNESINNIFNEIYLLGKKNSNLRKTRDLLLPKLMSGEVEI